MPRCDSVDQLQDRLSSIESHLHRMTLALEQSHEQNTAAPLGESLAGKQEDVEEWEHDADTDGHASVIMASPSQLSEENWADGWYTGPHSIAALCGNLRQHILSVHGHLDRDGLAQKLQTLCETATATETVPISSNQQGISLPPKQEVMAAVKRVLEYGDCITDLFVPSHLLAQLELVYSRPNILSDTLDSWAICFETLTVLALTMGKVRHRPGPTTSFANIAKSWAPNRASLITSGLLAKPSLINVQVLILLSIAAEQSDPPELAESIFAQACMLARMMSMRQRHLPSHDDNDIETVELEKARRSLYIRDRGLCITRGTVSWLPPHACDFIKRLSVEVDPEKPYHIRVRLAMIQDEVYLLNQAAYTDTPSSRRSLGVSIESIQRQLAEFATTFAIFDLSSPSKLNHNVGIGLEFLATRILALRLSRQQGHLEQVRLDARASCLLLLIANGARAEQIIPRFHLLTSSVLSSSTASPVNHETATRFMCRAMDAFSIPSYFFLSQDVISDLIGDYRASSSNEDLQLLRQVSECCTRFVSSTESNSYHRKVAGVLHHVLDIAKFIDHPGESKIPKCPSEDKAMTDTSPGSSIPCPLDFPDAAGKLPQQNPHDSHWPIIPDHPGLLWGDWAPMPSGLDAAPPLGVVGIGSVSYPSQDHLAQPLTTQYTLPEGLDQPVYYQGTEGASVNRRKRPQMEEWDDGGSY
ncbi:fungal specific transcription factor domain-containing protein [Aspergillus mulundensis]|uniref:Transcription factor domain-containing protein n=1 Tax=Aspergillus mulundensis TaxID=1810919 RepID=A0A3D8RFL6_9EURO|nr:hypothetical protein DSM5745_07928 [Aspergillus mulundensis]RDW72756.1 hypothetical protein DSM5745_07928 [Aspergillus mulundensis]